MRLQTIPEDYIFPVSDTHKYIPSRFLFQSSRASCTYFCGYGVQPGMTRQPKALGSHGWGFPPAAITPEPVNVTASGKAQCLRATYYKDGIRNMVGNTGWGFPINAEESAALVEIPAIVLPICQPSLPIFLLQPAKELISRSFRYFSGNETIVFNGGDRNGNTRPKQ